MRITRILQLLPVAATLAGATPAAAQTSRGGGRVSSAEALATFDSAWSRVRNTHYDTAMRGVDWARVREELRPRAEGAATLSELRGVLTELAGLASPLVTFRRIRTGIRTRRGRPGPDAAGTSASRSASSAGSSSCRASCLGRRSQPA